MRKIGQSACRVICRMLFIGMSVQIVLGLFWMVPNFFQLQEFGDSFHYIEISKSFICDEYIGILYPVFIFLARGAATFFHIPFYCILYVVQLVTAYYASHRFLNTVIKTSKVNTKKIGIFWKIWGTLCLMAIPMVMQCHMAVLPHSLTLSLFLIMFSYIIEAIRQPDVVPTKTVTKIMVLWVLTALLMPEYKMFAGVPVFVFSAYTSLRLWKTTKKQVLFHAVSLLISLGIILVVGNLTQVPGSHGKMQKTYASAAVSRFVWPWFMENYTYWPQEIQEIMSIEDARNISWFSDNVIDEFGPLVESKAGVENAQALYWQMVRISFNIHTRGIVKNIAMDAVSYSVPPLMLMKSLSGAGQESYSGSNYEIMKEQAPGITKRYVHFGNWWFIAGGILSCIAFVLSFDKILFKNISFNKISFKKKSTKKILFNKIKWNQAVSILLLIVTSAVMVVYYTMSGAGIMDYKNTIFVSFLWYVWMMRILKESCKYERTFDENALEEIK